MAAEHSTGPAALAKRDAQVAKMITNAPTSAQGVLKRAFLGSGGRQNAIRAQCLVCVGYLRLEITNCTGWSCPLWRYRPYQADDATDAEVET